MRRYLLFVGVFREVLITVLEDAARVNSQIAGSRFRSDGTAFGVCAEDRRELQVFF